MKAYLAHSVHKRERGKEIQKRLEGMGIEVYNPFYSHDRQDILDLDKGIVRAWDITDEDTSMIIVDLDLEGVRKSDVLICVYPDGVSVGIPCEMMFAWMINIVIFSVVPEKLKGHPWIVALSDGVFSDIDSLYDTLHLLMMDDEVSEEK